MFLTRGFPIFWKSIFLKAVRFTYLLFYQKISKKNLINFSSSAHENHQTKKRKIQSRTKFKT